MNKTVLVVAAHSDDEALGCGGTIAKHVASGDEVHLLFMTDGVGARVADFNEADKRISCAREAAKILGCKSLVNLNFPDNQLDLVPLLDVVKEIELKIHELQPQVIYTHHVGDLNIDHQIAHRATITACRPQPGTCIKEIFGFEVVSATDWSTPHVSPFIPTTFVDISSTFGIKMKSVRAYDIEMKEHPHSRCYESVEALAKYRGCSVGVSYAEGFSTIRQLR